MNNINSDKKRKRLFISMAAVLFLFLGVFVTQGVQWLVAAEEWAKLLNDIDHRMPPNDEKLMTNSDGIRSGREASDIKEDDFNIIFLGDSFIYGFLLTQDQFPPPARLQEKLRAHFKREDINVWNFGWTTSSPILQKRLLQDIGAKYQPDLVLLAVDMSDYRDDYFYRHVIAEDGVFGIAKKYPRLMFYYKQFLTELEVFFDWHREVWGYSARPGYFVAMQPLETNRHLFDELYDSLNQINAYCEKELNLPFLVFIPPRHWQYTDKESLNTWEKGSFEVMGPYALENYKYFAEKQPSTPYPLVSLLDGFKNANVYPTTFDRDSHWNKHGAQLMSDLVFQYLLENKYLTELEANVHHSPQD